MSCMKQYRPKEILLCGDTPLDQCLCDHCENCEQILKTLHAIGLQNVPSNRYSAIELTVCNERRQQMGCNLSFPKIECINGTCESCGVINLKELIHSSNQQALQENKCISWQKWMKRDGKSAPEKLQIKGTLRQCVNELLHILERLKGHLFLANWNRNVFDYIRKNLNRGYIVQIF